MLYQCWECMGNLPFTLATTASKVKKGSHGDQGDQSEYGNHLQKIAIEDIIHTLDLDLGRR